MTKSLSKIKLRIRGFSRKCSSLSRYRQKESHTDTDTKAKVSRRVYKVCIFDKKKKNRPKYKRDAFAEKLSIILARPSLLILFPVGEISARNSPQGRVKSESDKSRYSGSILRECSYCAAVRFDMEKKKRKREKTAGKIALFHPGTKIPRRTSRYICLPSQFFLRLQKPGVHIARCDYQPNYDLREPPPFFLQRTKNAWRTNISTVHVAYIFIQRER